MLALAGCSRQKIPYQKSETGAGDRTIQFIVPGVFHARVKTKADEVTVLDQFHVGCVTGTLGTAEEEEWNATFTSDGEETPTYAGDKYWPVSDASYKFYASNIPMTASATGYTVSASNATDVVCAVLADPDYCTTNVLSFQHIFARLGNVTVSAAANYTLSDVSILIKPQVSGTYDLYAGNGHNDGTGWSSLVAGEEVNIAPATPGTLANNLWLVPGTYRIIANWTASWDDYSKRFEYYAADIQVRAGAVNNLSITLGGDSGPGVKFGMSVSPFTDEAPTALAMSDLSQLPVTFGGLMIAPCNTMYNGSNMVIPFDDWNHCSYGSTYGLNNGSYYFGFIQTGSKFDSRMSSFNTSSGNIRNDITLPSRKVNYGGYDDWRVPTQAEWYTLTWGTSPGTERPGSRVNGDAGVKFAFIDLPGVVHGGNTGVKGLLLFPDNRSMTGQALSDFNGTTLTTFTNDQLNAYLSQGCVFLPASGEWRYSGWFGIGTYGYYLTATSKNDSYSYAVQAWNANFLLNLEHKKTNNPDNLSLRLVRTAQ